MKPVLFRSAPLQAPFLRPAAATFLCPAGVPAMGDSPLITSDNTDPHFKWIGNWFDAQNNRDEWGDAGPPFLGTLQGINSDGGLYFTFRGTSVMLWGSVRVVSTGANNTERDPDWDCFIDGRKIEFVTYYPKDQYTNFLMCNATDITEGDHTIQLMARIHRSTLWVDSAQFIAARDLDISGLWTEVQYPDTRFNYSEGWASSPEFYTTTTYTTGASVTLDFDGEAIIWGGQNPSSASSTKAGLASWSIDDGPSRNFTIPVSSVDMYNQPYFNVTGLKPGRHKLQVTNRGDNSTAPLAFSFLYMKNSSKSNKAAIIGGAVGGGVGAILLILLIVFLIFRKRRQRENRSGQLPQANPAPFNVDEMANVLPAGIPVHKSPVDTSVGSSISQQRPSLPHTFTGTSGSSYLVPSHTSTSIPLFSPTLPSQSDTDSFNLDPRFYPSSTSSASVSGLGSPPPYQPDLPAIQDDRPADVGAMTYFSRAKG